MVVLHNTVYESEDVYYNETFFIVTKTLKNKNT